MKTRHLIFYFIHHEYNKDVLRNVRRVTRLGHDLLYYLLIMLWVSLGVGFIHGHNLKFILKAF